jgi:microcompartment protein CcmK/EutM
MTGTDSTGAGTGYWVLLCTIKATAITMIMATAAMMTTPNS